VADVCLSAGDGFAVRWGYIALLPIRPVVRRAWSCYQPALLPAIRKCERPLAAMPTARLRSDTAEEH